MNINKNSSHKNIKRIYRHIVLNRSLLCEIRSININI